MAYSVKPMLVGVRSADQGMMTYQTGYGKPCWLPMWSFLVSGEGKNILVDTGLEDFVTPPGFTEETGLEPQYMEDALKEHGLVPDDISIVINTHLHDDHCENNYLFTKAKHYIQKRELEFCRNPHPIDGRYAEELIDGLDIVEVDGDLELLPGLELIFTPGHSPGCQSVRIKTGKGPVVIAGMCTNAMNFPETGAAVCPGVHTDAIVAYDSAQKIKGLGETILPLHEVSVAGKQF